METGKNFIGRAKSILKKLSLCMIILFSLLSLSCDRSEKVSSEKDMTEDSKSLIEQAVDWCNDNNNLLEGDGEYKSYTLQTKESDGKKYYFLYWEDEGWACELYYIETDEQDLVQRVTALSGGNKEQFSYDVVKLSGENYAAVYSSSHMGNGDLILFPLDNEKSSTYTIEGAIDHHYESISTVDENGTECMSSQIYYNGRLTADYEDVNEDGFTDIILTGIVLKYTGYSGEEYFNGYGQLTDSLNCKRTYLYQKNEDQFVQSEELLESINGKDEKVYDYSGYLDINPSFAEDNPEYDYDGDGLTDRIYKQFNDEEGTSSFYIHFGNGNKLLLAEQNWGIFYKTEAVDMTGDGVKEILFEQFSISTKCQNLYLSIYTLKDGSYERMNIPYYGEPDSNGEVDGMLYLPLIMKKINDSSVSIYQPDSDYEGRITTQRISSGSEAYDEMEHLYFPDIEGKEQNYQASELQFVDTGDGGKKAFLFRSYLGDKWCSKSVYWKLEYVEGEWKITDLETADSIRLDIGSEFTADLNGDKAEDTVYYDIKTARENGMDYEVPYFRINGIEYTYQDLMDKFGVFTVTCSKVGYYITDIDATDSYREIAILDEGPSSDPVTYFFRIIGKELQYCGMITDLPSNSTFVCDGSGSITARKRLGILQTWWADATWRLNEKGYLEEQPQEVYYPYQYETDEDTTNRAKQVLQLYKNKEKNSDTVTIKKGEVIALTATDNKNWIQVTSESGTTGWFYLHDNYKVSLPTGEVEVSDIVSYLCMAD
ncbi:MAG: peptidase BlaR1 [Herbinix sp.]|jgi:hypothetical protein|nr:peptidase BlaR1 [Herbinix sp.]